MTRFAFGAKFGKPDNPPSAFKSPPSSEANAATPTPVDVREKKCRRVMSSMLIPWSPLRPYSKSNSPSMRTQPAPAYRATHRYDSRPAPETSLRPPDLSRTGHDGIANSRAEPRAPSSTELAPAAA